jgi:SAM-dependent methyltransferase
MDFGDPQVRRAFFDVHDGLPREGPGSRDGTARALALAGPLPTHASVLDIACGPGMQTMDLAALLPEARIVALDIHAPFLAEVQRRAGAGGAADRIATVLGDMGALPFPAGSFDLLCCEGAAYMLGLAPALRAWRPLLRPGGRLALTEAVWLRPDPPEAVRHCWAADHPGMDDVESCRLIAEKCGYALLGDFVLPESPGGKTTTRRCRSGWRNWRRAMPAMRSARPCCRPAGRNSRPIASSQRTTDTCFW